MNLEYIIHQIRAEIKTDPATGHGTASIRATARLADVNESSLRRAFDCAALEPSELAKTLITTGFDGAALAKFSETGIPDTAVAVILEYYAFDAGRYRKEQAALVCRAFLRIGIRAWMQDITGYKKPETQKVDFEEFLVKQLPFTPTQWACRFKPEFWASLEKLYGLQRGQQACGMFISHWVYGYFPQEVRERLNEINPTLDENYTRKHRHHQHFDDKLLKALEMQISLVTTNLIRAKNKHHFKRLMKGARRYKFTIHNLPLIGE